MGWWDQPGEAEIPRASNTWTRDRQTTSECSDEPLRVPPADVRFTPGSSNGLGQNSECSPIHRPGRLGRAEYRFSQLEKRQGGGDGIGTRSSQQPLRTGARQGAERATGMLELGSRTGQRCLARRRVRIQRPAPSRSQSLPSPKAQHGQIPQATEGPLVERSTDPLGGIFDDQDARGLQHPTEAVKIHRDAVEMDSNDSSSIGGEGRPEGGPIGSQCGGIQVIPADWNLRAEGGGHQVKATVCRKEYRRAALGLACPQGQGESSRAAIREEGALGPKFTSEPLNDAAVGGLRPEDEGSGTTKQGTDRQRGVNRQLAPQTHGMYRTIPGPSAVASGRGNRFQIRGPQLNAPSSGEGVAASALPRLY